jgi:ubiquitin carboxyl-terminal hydrolase 14
LFIHVVIVIIIIIIVSISIHVHVYYYYYYSIGLWKGVLKDDENLLTLDLPGALVKNKGLPLQILLMGSATQLAAPKTKVVFLEDLPPEEIAKVVEPSGLTNMGNTCYLNSVVQCLRVIEPFRKGLDQYRTNIMTNQQQPSSSSTNRNSFLLALQDLFSRMDRTADAVIPAAFVQITKMTFPQFNQLSPQGHPAQQDAEEFFSGLLTQAATASLPMDSVIPSSTSLGASNLMDAIFGMAMEETMTCNETPEEPPVVKRDLLRKLTCNIQGGTATEASSSAVASSGAGRNVGHIYEGILLGLEGTIEKNSDILGRNALWTRQQRIARLPPILVVQFGRFYWKATPDSQDHSGVKCKILKKVAFTSTLDVFDFCNPTIRTILQASRDRARQNEEAQIQAKLEGKETSDTNNNNDDDMEVEKQDVDDNEEELKQALEMSMELDPVGPGLPPNFQGHYELFAVVTHKGRNADGGHYMGWVKATSSSTGVDSNVVVDENQEDWFVFNDDEVSPCKTEDILKLQGGGDYDMSYLNFYRAKK